MEELAAEEARRALNNEDVNPWVFDLRGTLRPVMNAVRYMLKTFRRYLPPSAAVVLGDFDDAGEREEM